ncbi:hypothetical protein DRJ25_06085 [Candidatus Woesearchaeota archaeon]|nr:MAG: hypothetical protein DRJ25_06085 [Candidatus Woesearchaeota archaeon]
MDIETKTLGKVVVEPIGYISVEEFTDDSIKGISIRVNVENGNEVIMDVSRCDLECIRDMITYVCDGL